MTCGFQSTCPARGTTLGRLGGVVRPQDFNPRAPRGARRRRPLRGSLSLSQFQSTCPARGTTPATGSVEYKRFKFQSTCPARGTTTSFCSRSVRPSRISIHVPREGHDVSRSTPRSSITNFNPRAPRGARLRYLPRHSFTGRFQSTCPARGTTTPPSSCARQMRISIHVPREGHDREASDHHDEPVLISIHVPREGHDAIA